MSCALPAVSSMSVVGGGFESGPSTGNGVQNLNGGSGMPGIDFSSQGIAGDAVVNPASEPSGDLTFQGDLEGFENAQLYRDENGTEFYTFTPPNADGTPGSSEFMFSADEVAALQASPDGQAFLAGLDGGAGGSVMPGVDQAA